MLFRLTFRSTTTPYTTSQDVLSNHTQRHQPIIGAKPRKREFKRVRRTTQDFSKILLFILFLLACPLSFSEHAISASVCPAPIVSALSHLLLPNLRYFQDCLDQTRSCSPLHACYRHCCCHCYSIVR